MKDTRNRATSRGGRKPDLVCVGAQKAGTTWLYKHLSERPDVWAPPFKEQHFFDYRFLDNSKVWAPWHIKKGVKEAIEIHRNRCSPPNLEYLGYLNSILKKPMFNGNWYKAIFAPAPIDSLCLDFTPAYSSLPEEGISFVASFLENTKFIYLIRRPFDRAVSQLKMNIIRSQTTPSSNKEWMEFISDPIFRVRGDYQTYVPMWRKYFDRSRLLFLPFSKLKNNPYGLLREIEIFTGLNSYDKYSDVDQRVNWGTEVFVPSFVERILRNETQKQDNFLKSFFGQRFYASI